MNSKLKQWSDLNYEQIRQQFAFDLHEILKENKLTLSDVEQRLGWADGYLQSLIYNDNLSLKDIAEITAALQGTCRIVIVIPRP